MKAEWEKYLGPDDVFHRSLGWACHACEVPAQDTAEWHAKHELEMVQCR
jgi:hypothetical protein